MPWIEEVGIQPFPQQPISPGTEYLGMLLQLAGLMQRSKSEERAYAHSQAATKEQETTQIRSESREEARRRRAQADQETTQIRSESREEARRRRAWAEQEAAQIREEGRQRAAQEEVRMDIETQKIDEEQRREAAQIREEERRQKLARQQTAEQFLDAIAGLGASSIESLAKAGVPSGLGLPLGASPEQINAVVAVTGGVLSQLDVLSKRFGVPITPGVVEQAINPLMPAYISIMEQAVKELEETPISRLRDKGKFIERQDKALGLADSLAQLARRTGLKLPDELLNAMGSFVRRAGTSEQEKIGKAAVREEAPPLPWEKYSTGRTYPESTGWQYGIYGQPLRE